MLGTKLSNASLASLINSTNPIFIILFAVLILKEKLTFHKFICVIAAICSFPVSTYELIVIQNVHLFNPTVMLSLLYIGLICTALSHVLCNESLSMIEAGSCSLFYPLQPMVSVLLGWLLLGENITIRFALGAILIISGILFSVVGNQNKEISTEEIDSVY